MPSRSGRTTSRPRAGAWAWEASGARSFLGWSRTASDACSVDSDHSRRMGTSIEVQFVVIALDLDPSRCTAPWLHSSSLAATAVFLFSSSLLYCNVYSPIHSGGVPQCEFWNLLLFHCFSSALRSGICEAEYMRILYVTGQKRRRVRERCKCREEDEECDELNRIAEWRAIERERGLDKI